MLTREQVEGDCKTICECCESITVQEHIEVLLAHDAEQRQTIEVEQQKVAAACEVIEQHKQTIDAQAQEQ